MNNSSMRFYTLASCSGLLALTACGSQEATTPPTQPTQSANTPPPKINLRSQSVIPLPRSATGPELSPTALVRSRAIALSGGGSPFSDQEIQARLQQARLKREQLAKTRLAQLQAQRSPVVTSTVTSLPRQPINLNPNLPKPLIPAPPPASTLADQPIPTAASQVPPTTVSSVNHVSATSPDPTSPSSGVASKPGSTCPGLVQPGPLQISLATVKVVAPTAPTDQVTSPLLQSPHAPMGKALEASHHQSYSALRGTFPCLTATRLPSQAMRLHSQVLYQNPQDSTRDSRLSPQGSIGAESLRNRLVFGSLSPEQGQRIDDSRQSPLTSPETFRQRPGFSSRSLAHPGFGPEATNGQEG